MLELIDTSLIMQKRLHPVTCTRELMIQVLTDRYISNVVTSSGNEWVLEDPNVAVHPGDTVNYWYNYIQNGEGHLVQDQSWRAASKTYRTHYFSIIYFARV